MSILRMDRNVPVNYVKESRDFQILLRLLTIAQSNAKYNIDSIQYLNDPFLINNRLLHLLCTKLGFYTHENFTDDEIRHVLSAFMFLIKNKGNRIAIESAVNLFFKVNKITAESDIYIDNVNYIVNIGLNLNPRSTTLLEELFRYILPTGYLVNIYFYSNKPAVDYMEANINFSVADIPLDENAHINNYKIVPIQRGYTTAITIIDASDIGTIYEITNMGKYRIIASSEGDNIIKLNQIDMRNDDTYSSPEEFIEKSLLTKNLGSHRHATVYKFQDKLVFEFGNIDVSNSFNMDYYVGSGGDNRSVGESKKNKFISTTWNIRYSLKPLDVNRFRCSFIDDSNETIEMIMNDLLVTTPDGRIIRDFKVKLSDDNSTFTIIIDNQDSLPTGFQVHRKLSTKNFDTMFIMGEKIKNG